MHLQFLSFNGLLGIAHAETLDNIVYFVLLVKFEVIVPFPILLTIIYEPLNDQNWRAY